MHSQFMLMETKKLEILKDQPQLADQMMKHTEMCRKFMERMMQQGNKESYEDDEEMFQEENDMGNELLHVC